MQRLAIVFLFAALLACSAQIASPVTTQADLPQGWLRSGSAPNAYTMALDPTTLHEGHAAMAIASKADAAHNAGDFGTVMTKTDATPYRGKRVRLTGFVRASAVTGWAGLWLRVDDVTGRVLAMDNMHARSIRGTSDWTSYEVVLDVDAAATQLAFGALLVDGGSIWFDGLKVETADASAPITGIKTFEAGSARGLTPRWLFPSNDYVASADATVHHGATTSVSLVSPTPAPSDKFGTAMLTVPAASFRGANVRLTAYVKAEDVRGWAGLWLRVDGAPSTRPLAFDNMHDRPIQGTHDWARYVITLNVPADAEKIALGLLLSGQGHVWMDDVVLESVP